jgi:hypothetical protein
LAIFSQLQYICHFIVSLYNDNGRLFGGGPRLEFCNAH